MNVGTLKLWFVFSISYGRMRAVKMYNRFIVYRFSGFEFLIKGSGNLVYCQQNGDSVMTLRGKIV